VALTCGASWVDGRQRIEGGIGRVVSKTREGPRNEEDDSDAIARRRAAAALPSIDARSIFQGRIRPARRGFLVFSFTPERHPLAELNGSCETGGQGDGRTCSSFSTVLDSTRSQRGRESKRAKQKGGGCSSPIAPPARRLRGDQKPPRRGVTIGEVDWSRKPRSMRRACARKSHGWGREGGAFGVVGGRSREIDDAKGEAEGSNTAALVLSFLSGRALLWIVTHRRNPFPCPSCPLRLI